MADTKITALAAIATVDPAADVLPIVDISDTSMAASGTTKKVTSNQILGAGGTATLASATITGALTVDTTTLVVDATNNRVGIGTASPQDGFEVVGNSFFRGAAAGVRVGDGGGYGYVSAYGPALSGAKDLVLQTGGGNVGVGVTPVAGSGAIQLNAGVGFPATQVASSDANCLDDYEEGTWTGTIGGTTANPFTPVIQTGGRYTKIGRQVSVEIGFYGDTTGASGRITVSGLPFTSNASLSRPGVIAMDTMGTFTGSPVAYLASGVTSVDLYASNSNASSSNVTHNAGAGRALYMELTYTV